MNKFLVLSIVVSILAIGGIVVITREKKDPALTNVVSSTNVRVVDGTQQIDIRARGGYSPADTVATANIPTTLLLTTNSTFDCSAAFTIPSIGYRKMLPPNGVTSVDLPPQKPGTTLNGLCAMGMYHFTIRFE